MSGGFVYETRSHFCSWLRSCRNVKKERGRCASPVARCTVFLPLLPRSFCAREMLSSIISTRSGNFLEMTSGRLRGPRFRSLSLSAHRSLILAEFHIDLLITARSLPIRDEVSLFSYCLHSEMIESMCACVLGKLARRF